MEEICVLLQKAETMLKEIKRRESELPKDWPGRLNRANYALRNSQEKLLENLLIALRPIGSCNLGQTSKGNLDMGYDVLNLAGHRIALSDILKNGLFYQVAILLVQKVREMLIEVPQLATVLEIIGDIINEKKEQNT